MKRAFVRAFALALMVMALAVPSIAGAAINPGIVIDESNPKITEDISKGENGYIHEFKVPANMKVNIPGYASEETDVDGFVYTHYSFLENTIRVTTPKSAPLISGVMYSSQEEIQPFDEKTYTGSYTKDVNDTIYYINCVVERTSQTAVEGAENLQPSWHYQYECVPYKTLARDAKIVIDATSNAEMVDVVPITGTIKLTDKSINISTERFQIKDGEGTFTVKSNQKITLNKVLRGSSYEITVNKPDNTSSYVIKGAAADPASGTIDEAATVKISLDYELHTPDPGETPGQGDDPSQGEDPGQGEGPAVTQKDGKLVIDATSNADLAEVFTITGTISLSDKSLELSTDRFSIKNGEGTFTVKSNQKITMTGLARDLKYEIKANLPQDTENYKATAITAVPSSGTVGQTSTVAINMTAEKKSSGGEQTQPGGETPGPSDEEGTVIPKDGKLVIDATSGAALEEVITMTGKISLSDKTLDFVSERFNIKDGEGTFTVRSNQKISLSSLPRDLKYEISMDKPQDTDHYTIKSVTASPASGTVGEESAVTVSINAEKKSTQGGDGPSDGEETVTPPEDSQDKDYDGKLVIDATGSTNVSEVFTITGNITLSDKNVTIKSDRFNIKDGSGTFTVKSNQKISLKGILRGAEYKIEPKLPENTESYRAVNIIANHGEGKVTTDTNVTLKMNVEKITKPEIETSQKLWAKVLPSGKKLKVSWNRMDGAKYYMVYGAKAGKKLKKIKKISGTSLKVKVKNRNSVYSYRVIAYGSGGQIVASPTVKSIGKKYNKKYSNVKKISAPASILIKKGTKKTISVKQTRYNKKKAYLGKGTIKYSWTDSSIMSMSGNTIKGKKAGTCYLDVMAVNGLHKRIKVTVY